MLRVEFDLFAALFAAGTGGCSAQLRLASVDGLEMADEAGPRST